MGFVTKQLQAATLAHQLGYSLAGFVRDVYEGAEILIPDDYFGYTSSDSLQQYEYDNNYVAGRVISDPHKDGEGLMSYVIGTNCGITVAFNHSPDRRIYFQIPI